MYKFILKTILASAIFLFGVVAVASRAEETDIFQTKYKEAGVAESFVAGKQWFPYPVYEDRGGWDELFGIDKKGTISKGEKFLDYQWKTIPATAYLAYERSGDRSVMESLIGANKSALISLILAELAEGEGRFIDQIVNGVWLSAQQYSWVLSAHQPRQESGRSLPDNREHFIDLGSGSYGSVMSIAYYFFHDEFDKLDPSISYSVETAIKEKILDPYLDVEKYTAHWWLGLGGGNKIPALNNWNPWCNSDAILCFLLMEKDQQRLNFALDRATKSVDMFMKSIQQDGGCEEGSSYWGHAAGKLYDWLQILYDASDGKFDLFENERIRRMGEFISRTYIGDGYVVNFADASAKLDIEKELVWNYGNAVGSKEMKDFALFCCADRSKENFKYPSITTGDLYRSMQNLRFNPLIRQEVDSLNSLVQDSSFQSVLLSLRKDVPASTWYEETEVCYFRNSSRWFFAAKGGYNDESHNHNDIGTCVLYIRDIPVLADAGVGTYTKQTFSADRYELWTMQGEWHNVPIINGVAQEFGRKYCSKDPLCSTSKGTFSLDLAEAYPEDAHCRKWVRRYALSLVSEAALTISDSFTLDKRTGADVEHFLVKGQVLLPGENFNGRTIREGELLILCDDGLVVKMQYSKKLRASVDEKNLDDTRLTKVWGTSLQRINLTSSDNAQAKGGYEIKITEL